MMSAIICKLCSQRIKTPTSAMVVGLSQQERLHLIATALGSHLQTAGAHEQQAAAGLPLYGPTTNSKPNPATNSKPNPAAAPLPPMLHQQAVGSCILHGAAVQGYFTLQCFVLTPELEAIQEQNRHIIHEWSRKVRFTDEELKARIEADGIVGHTIWNYLRDLRDEYEGLGIHAPKAPTSTAGPVLA
jgi:hypothetical protein